MIAVATAFAHVARILRAFRRINARGVRALANRQAPPADEWGNRHARRVAEGSLYSSLRRREWRETIAALRSMGKGDA